VLGDLHLGLSQDVLDVADAERAVTQEVEDAQPGRVAQAFVDFDEVDAADGIYL